MTNEKKSLISALVWMIVFALVTVWTTIILVLEHGMSEYLGPLVALAIGCSLGATGGAVAFLIARVALKAVPTTQEIK